MPSKKPGRPRATDITDAIKKTAARTMATDGYSKLSVDGLATEVGTTRPTFYRRYPSIAHLVLEILDENFGAGPEANTGSLRGDLLAMQVDHVKMMASPLVSKTLAGLFEEIANDPSVHDIYRDQFVLPRRAHVRRVITAAVERGEISPATDLQLEAVCDMLNGPVISRVLLPIDAPLNDGFARSIVDAVCAFLGAPPAK
ncbi:TetR/AcrR family transcriptional regulator [Microbacterium bovistercoris]|nr:TetR/AcrR family transcriptional regulator [Microbacterium bovistercoris]